MGHDKKIYIPIWVQEVQPRLYTLIFLIDNEYSQYQIAAYSLEQAVDKSRNINCKRNLSNLWWYFSISIQDIKSTFKSLKNGIRITTTSNNSR